MPSPAIAFTLSGPLYGGSSVAAYTLLVQDTKGFYLPATAANRATYGRCRAMSLDAYGGSLPGGIRLQHIGAVDNGLSVGAGSAERWLRANASGGFEVFTPVNGGSSDIVGKAAADGSVTLEFGIWTETMAAGGGGGGGGTPGGSSGQWQYNNAGAFDGKTGNATGGPLIAPATLVDGDIYYASGGALAKLAKGTAGQVLTQGATFPTWADLPLDPTTLALSAFYRGSYLGTSPWSSTGSAGNSGAMSLTQATGTAVPAQGVAVDGFFPCAPDGTDDSLRDNVNTAAPYLGSTTYTIAVMFKAPAGVAPNANAYSDQQIMCGTADIIGISWTSSGVRAWHYDGSNWAFTPLIACSANAWHLVTVTFSGGTLSCRVDLGSPQTVAKGNVVGLAAANIQIGRTSTGGVFDAIQRMELLTASSALSLATLTRYQTYLKNRYPSAGLP